MIVNTEQDNTIEGEYLKIISTDSDHKLEINLPEDFYITNSISGNWLIGWGSNKPLYDAGVENLRKIDSIDFVGKTIIPGKLLRGSGFPDVGQRIVFWNINPSGFFKEKQEPVIDAQAWPAFKGESISFGSIIYDSTSQKWVMFIQEVDTACMQIYAAISDDLLKWEAANNGNPVFKPGDFKETSWAGIDKSGTIKQTASLSDIIRYNKKWYFFMDGYDKKGMRHIGIAIAEKSIFGPYKILPDPVISPGNKGNWNDECCFYAKVKSFKNKFILAYDGRNQEGTECMGMASSGDLLHWENYDVNPVLDQHTGWRSSVFTTEPCYLETRGDSIFLLAAGAKKFQLGIWTRYVTRRMYLDKSGNVNDTQLGVFLSVDGGKSFIPYKNNPIFVNDYSDLNENDHMGGCFKLIKTDTADFIFYTAKTSYPIFKYNIFCRIKRKVNI